MKNKPKKSILYRLAGKLSNILREYQKSQNRIAHRISQKKWDKLFENKNNFIFELDNDVKIKLYNDSVLSKFIYDGFEKNERDFVMAMLGNDDIFVDVGSNVGLFSLIASKKVGDNGKVICFEPAPITFQRLEENINLNNFNNLDLRNIGLSNKQGNLKFYIYQNGYEAWNSFARDNNLESDDSIIVPVSTLDQELLNVNKRRIKVIKIDVEGWEKFVLLGGQNFFINFNPIVLIEFTELNTFNAGYGVHELFDIMTNWGYQWYRLGENNELKNETKQFRYPYVNLIAIKPEG